MRRTIELAASAQLSRDGFVVLHTTAHSVHTTFVCTDRFRSKKHTLSVNLISVQPCAGREIKKREKVENIIFREIKVPGNIPVIQYIYTVNPLLSDRSREKSKVVF